MWDAGIAMLKDAGAEVVEISLPHTKYALPAYYIIAPAEASSNLPRYAVVRYGMRHLPDGAGMQDMYAATRADGFGPEVTRRTMRCDERSVGEECVDQCGPSVSTDHQKKQKQN